MLRRYASFGGGDAWSKRAIISTQINRIDTAVNFSALRPKFMERDTYYSVRSKGSLMIEVVPKIPNQNDPQRMMYNFQSKRTFIYGFEHYYNFAELKDFTVTREIQGEQRTIDIKNLPDNKVELKFNIAAPEGENFNHQLIMDDWEVFMVKKFVDYSIPMMAGWYGMYDQTFAMKNIADDDKFNSYPS